MRMGQTPRWEMWEANITPYINLDSCDPMTPTFTTADSIASAAALYARAPVLNRATLRTGPLESVAARFMPTDAVRQIPGMMTVAYEPSSEVVFLVRLSGEHLYAYGRTSHYFNVTQAYLIFDGKRGGLLKIGMKPSREPYVQQPRQAARQDFNQ